jgi:hypothetical protein
VRVCCRSASRQLDKEIAPRPRNSSPHCDAEGASERVDVAGAEFLRGVLNVAPREPRPFLWEHPQRAVSKCDPGPTCTSSPTETPTSLVPSKLTRRLRARFPWISLASVGYATIADGRFRYATGVPNWDPFPQTHWRLGQFGRAGHMLNIPSKKPPASLMRRFSLEQCRALKMLVGAPRAVSTRKCSS